MMMGEEDEHAIHLCAGRRKSCPEGKSCGVSRNSRRASCKSFNTGEKEETLHPHKGDNGFLWKETLFLIHCYRVLLLG